MSLCKFRVLAMILLFPFSSLDVFISLELPLCYPKVAVPSEERRKNFVSLFHGVNILVGV